MNKNELPEPGSTAEPASAAATTPPMSAKQLFEAWQDLLMNFAVLMKAFRADAAWLERLVHMSGQVRALLAQDVDVALYVMLQVATSEVDHYSAHHAMHCAIVSELCAEWFDWPAQERRVLFLAALTMNLGMQTMQDGMAKHAGVLSAGQRKQIEQHPAQGAALLRNAGVTDQRWLDIVLRHHDPGTEGEATDPLQPARRLAELLHRVDVFTAKLSRRQSRPGVSATVAARDACLDESGAPDAIGATIIRALGLYPPGSFVRLVNGEMAVVTRRGNKAHTPIVACLRHADGSTYARPHRRDTRDMAEYAVQRAIVGAELKLFINHERVLAA